MDQVSQIRTKVDIVSFISEYIPLKKMGRNFTACCPFHNEKTPSFVVSPERQIWHCFGCQKGGDVFTFLMEYESMEFPEALRFLAKKTGIELIEQKGVMGISSKKEKIYKVNRQAMEFYHFVLTKHPAGKAALNYLLKGRKIKEAVINTFMLGFSPASGRALSEYLIKKKNYKKEDLIEAGLSFYRNGKTVDFFAGRLMFPLFDHRDNIIGFSGRVINPSDSLSKYVNTRETLIYHKGDVFFGLNIAKDRIKKENQAIVVEGEFDVISCFEEGITNVVAVKGTALTENQVSLISRFTQKVTLCFDQDKAGQDAIKRSLQNLEKKGLTTTIIVIPNGKDPDESIKNDPFIFKKAVSEDINVYDYLISKSVSEFGNKTVEGKKKIGDELLPLIFKIENEIVKEHYFKKLSIELDTTYDAIIRQIEKIGKKEKDDLVLTSKVKKPRKEILEEYLLSLIIQYEDQKKALEKLINVINEDVFEILSFKRIYAFFLLLTKNDDYSLDKLLKELPAELLPAFDKCYLFPVVKFEDESKYIDEIVKVANELKMLYLKNRLKELGDKIKGKDEIQDNEELEKLREEFKNTTSLLRT